MKHTHCRLLFTLAAGSAVAAGCAVAHDDEADEALPMGINVGPGDRVYDAGTVAVLDAGVVAIDAGVVIRDATVPQGVVAAQRDAQVLPVGLPPAPLDAGTKQEAGIAPGTVAVPPCPYAGGICATLPGIIIRHEQDASGADLPIGLVVRTESP